ncbi:SLC13 family permease [Blautia marasmi]|uniref:SLC13 family permease n=1 Tax=Blautia marasmi TaxID=1917868 RepID=UPI000CF2B384|nr:SLC13 family permease [Blautia marasmi]
MGNAEQIFIVGMIVVLIALLLTRKASLGWIGLLLPCALSVSGIITPAEAFSGLADKSMFIFVGAFVLSEAFFRVGLSDILGKWMQKRLKKVTSDGVILLVLSLCTAALSSMLSSLAVQVTMMSLVLTLGSSLKVSKTKSMMAIAYAATIGGMMTIMGTPLNMIGKAAYENTVPGDIMGIFEISLVTVPAGILMILYYCFVGSRYLPDRAGCMDVQPIVKSAVSRKNQILVALTFLFFILAVAPDQKALISAYAAGCAVILFLGGAGILSVNEIINAVRWDILMFIMGMKALGIGIEKVQLDSLLSEKAAGLFWDDIPDRILIAVVFLLVALITQFLNNTGTFGVVLPFVLVIASSLDVNLKPVMLTAMIASSCGFALPIAAPSYPMLAEEGGIYMGDWLRQGLPLVAVCFAACVVMIPVFWPL